MSSSEHGSGVSSSSTRSQRKPTTCTIPDPNSVEEHGRTYHGYREGKYYLPNDGDEQDRLDIQHKVWELMLKGKQWLAPVQNPRHVLDIAAGTGIWAIEFAKEHPESTVVGTDLSLIQPLNTPPNCSFIRDDAEDEWLFQERFDYIHLRAVCSCFSDPKAVMQKIFDNLEPGGWCEYNDWVPEYVADPGHEKALEDSVFKKGMDLFCRGMTNAGRDPAVTLQYKKWMSEIGFTDIVEKHLFSPINSWPLDPEDKLLGQFFHLDSMKGIDSLFKIMVAAGVPEYDVPQLLAEMKKSTSNTSLRAYSIFHAVYGRKPVV